MAAEFPDIFDFNDYATFLKEWFQAQKDAFEARGRLYSHRMFAQAAGLSHVGLLHQVMHGKRHLTTPLIAAIRKPLNLADHEAEFLDLLVRREQAHLEHERLKERLDRELERSAAAKAGRTAAARATAAQQAVEAAQRTLDQLDQEILGRQKMHRSQRATARLEAVLSTWYTPVIRDLMSCEGYREDVDWIYRALRGRVTPAQIREALEVLHATQAHAPGEVAEGKDARTSLVVEKRPNFDFRPFYTGIHEQAGHALESNFNNDPPGFGARSWLGAMTVALPGDVAERLRATIRQHQRTMFSAIEGLSGHPDSVYVVLVQAFPIAERPVDPPVDPAPPAKKKPDEA